MANKTMASPKIELNTAARMIFVLDLKSFELSALLLTAAVAALTGETEEAVVGVAVTSVVGASDFATLVEVVREAVVEVAVDVSEVVEEVKSATDTF
jgi:hypothetical protein